MSEPHQRDVVYLRTGGVERPATLYVPAGEGPFPAVVSVHGGTWVSGDRASDATVAAYLAANGVTVLAIDSRMPPAPRAPGAGGGRQRRRSLAQAAPPRGPDDTGIGGRDRILQRRSSDRPQWTA